MIEVPIFNISGQKVEALSVDEAKLGGAVNKALLKQVLVAYHANKRQGTVRTLARGEVEGSTRKIYRQKGTGNARMGSIRQPVRVGGGHAKQKRPKEWRLAIPRKMRQAARDQAILSKIQSNDIRVLDTMNLPAPKTKEMTKVYKALGIERSCLVALSARNEQVERAARNIQKTKITTVNQLNAWDIVNSRTLLLTKDGLQAILA